MEKDVELEVSFTNLNVWNLLGMKILSLEGPHILKTNDDSIIKFKIFNPQDRVLYVSKPYNQNYLIMYTSIVL